MNVGLYALASPSLLFPNIIHSLDQHNIIMTPLPMYMTSLKRGTTKLCTLTTATTQWHPPPPSHAHTLNSLSSGHFKRESLSLCGWRGTHTSTPLPDHSQCSCAALIMLFNKLLPGLKSPAKCNLVIWSQENSSIALHVLCLAHVHCIWGGGGGERVIKGTLNGDPIHACGSYWCNHCKGAYYNMGNL